MRCRGQKRHRVRNVLEIYFYPSWNVLEYTGILFLYYCTNPAIDYIME